jgi:Flp pilus assembly protein TadG
MMYMAIKNSLSRFRKDQSGTSVMEFGLIAPVAVLMMLGTMDIGHTYYVRAVLDGSMQEMARDSSLEGATTTIQETVIDRKVRESIRAVMPSATVTPSRRFYKTFSDAAAAQAEEIIEDDGDGICNNGEGFIDENNNDTWDEDGGDSGQGNAQDIVIIRVNVRFPRLFPMASMIGLPEQVNIDSNSILSNQPFGAQTINGPATTGICDA